MENWRQYLTEEKKKELLEEGWRETLLALGLMVGAVAPNIAQAGENDVIIGAAQQYEEDSEELPTYKMIQLTNEISAATVEAIGGTEWKRILDYSSFRDMAQEAHPGASEAQIDKVMYDVDSMGDLATNIDTNVLETYFSREANGINLSMRLVAPGGGTIGQEQGFIPQGGANTGEGGQGDASKIAIQDLVNQVFSGAEPGSSDLSAPETSTTPTPDVAPAGSETAPTQDVEPERPSLRQRFQQRLGR
jgi:hypothetical protein